MPSARCSRSLTSCPFRRIFAACGPAANSAMVIAVTATSAGVELDR